MADRKRELFRRGLEHAPTWGCSQGKLGSAAAEQRTELSPKRLREGSNILDASQFAF